MPMEREQQIKTATIRRVGTNYTLSGNTIRGGKIIILSGETAFYPCGHERAPGIDVCSCGM